MTKADIASCMQVAEVSRTFGFDAVVEAIQDARDRAERASVLILENGDIALTDDIVVAEVVEKLIHCRTDRPDQIWLVDTLLEDQWTVWCLRGNTLFPDEDTSVRYREFNPATLTEV
jgi:hypothetical protein